MASGLPGARSANFICFSASPSRLMLTLPAASGARRRLVSAKRSDAGDSMRTKQLRSDVISNLARRNSRTPLQIRTSLARLIETGGELEVVSKVIGRVAVVLLEWDANNTAEDGNKAIYSLTLKEVLRAGLTIADATPGALALNGTGGAVAPGSGGGSMATPGVLAVVP